MNSVLKFYVCEIQRTYSFSAGIQFYLYRLPHKNYIMKVMYVWVRKPRDIECKWPAGTSKNGSEPAVEMILPSER
jgi:hypothetical protein